MYTDKEPKYNSTILKFMSSENLIREFRHWILVYRYNQLTMYSMILLAKSNETNFYQLDNEEVAELGPILKNIEATLCEKFNSIKVNVNMLMLVDNHVHLHIFPRYGSDEFWPAPVDVTREIQCTTQQAQKRIKSLQLAFGEQDDY